MSNIYTQYVKRFFGFTIAQGSLANIVRDLERLTIWNLQGYNAFYVSGNSQNALYDSNGNSAAQLLQDVLAA